MRPLITKNAAIRFAEANVSTVYPFGHGYEFTHTDPGTNVLRSFFSSDYWQAAAQRRQRLALLACHHLGVPAPLAVQRGDMPGRWKDYVPNPETLKPCSTSQP